MTEPISDDIALDDIALYEKHERRYSFFKYGFVVLLALLFMFSLLLVSSLVGAMMSFIGIWAGLVLGAALANIAAWIFLKLFWKKRPRRLNHPGEVECPKCGSLQTDQVEQTDQVGNRQREWICFKCSHQGWQPRDVHT